MNKLTAVLSTNGLGYWSEVAKDVKVIGYTVPYINDEQDFGELRVYFDTKSWNVDTDGLIYTDRQFEKQLKDLLTQIGLRGDDVGYSEQGMQGDNYVSLDVGEAFIRSLEGRNEVANVLA
jgi:hypothetical protein